MLFNTFGFAVFLVVSWVIYRLLHRQRLPRLVWLLLISAFFYSAWRPWYLTLIALSTVLSYTIGVWMDRSEDPARRKLFLILGIVGDLTLLGTFKYGNFLMESAEVLIGLAGATIALPRVPAELPVGISFYTFQTLSYTIDLYFRRIERSRNLLEFAVFVSFFPQLVAGPIVRASEFLPQLQKRPRLDLKTVGEGTFLILAGLTKKMVIADSLYTLVVSPFFADPKGHDTATVLLALWAANFQVYCDFSGYTDVATGAALLFGFTLPLNFNRPFWSRSPMEHWRRWHISLSTWLRDYLYIPLGGSRKGPWRTDLNLVITFLLGGLWHGAGWTFVVWGLYNGVLLVVWRRYGPKPAERWWGKALEMAATFHAICFGLIFLHAESFGDAWGALRGLLTLRGGQDFAVHPFGLWMLAAAIALHATPQRWKTQLQEAFAVAPAWALGVIIIVVTAVLSLFSGMASPFFYFQF